MSTCTRNDDLCIPQGTDYTYQWPIVDANNDPLPSVTGWTAKSQARKRRSDTGAPLDEWTTADGSLELLVSTVDGVTASVLNMHFKHAQTTAWDWKKAYYDIELTSPTGDVTRLTMGKITVDGETTR